jgi:hypothetical protein
MFCHIKLDKGSIKGSRRTYSDGEGELVLVVLKLQLAKGVIDNKCVGFSAQFPYFSFRDIDALNGWAW